VHRKVLHRPVCGNLTSRNGSSAGPLNTSDLRRRSPRHCQQFRRVQAAVVAEVGDLVAAAEAGGNDQVIGRGPAHRGEEHALAAGLAHLVVALLVAEATRHPAASSVQDAELQTLHLAQHLARGLHADERLLMAVAVHGGAGLQAVRAVARPDSQIFSGPRHSARIICKVQPRRHLLFKESCHG
jgi:hypothetical protein